LLTQVVSLLEERGDDAAAFNLWGDLLAADANYKLITIISTKEKMVDPASFKRSDLELFVDKLISQHPRFPLAVPGSV
jgi:hypothetical protein